ncbi:FAD-dependent oxidoreductase domain-containing protein 2 [Genypterus blacodes]|uniref:FAD-dependent oxidoreductase domain-containing protein 2 n=1 Tax=Genypterus blacodes TaxID=154954 RepID=UPI003F775BA8
MDSSLHAIILAILIGLVYCSVNDASHHDYCILGAGPSGVQMGHFLQKANRDYMIFERNSGPGSFFQRYPRHRKLISINKIYTGTHNTEFNMRHDWNSLLSDRPDLLFQRFSKDFYPSADAYPLYLNTFVKELGLKLQYGTDIGKVRAMESPNGRRYILTDQRGSDYSCRVLVVATGLWVPQLVDFTGSDLVEGYENISVDPEDYKDQSVLILGKGNSAFETAQSLLGSASTIHMYSPNPVRIAWQTHYVGDLRAVNNELLDTYQLKSLDGLVEGSLEAIAIVKLNETESGSSRKQKKGGAKAEKSHFYMTLAQLQANTEGKNFSSDRAYEVLAGFLDDNFALRLPYDRVIRCLGFRFNFTIFDDSACPPKGQSARGRLPGLTAWYEGQGTPGLFVIGNSAHSRDYRASAGGFIHGFRYTARAVHRVLEQRYHSKAWPSTNLKITQLKSWILKRINEASGPYQMFRVLTDVILLKDTHCEYLEEFPIQAFPQFTQISGHEVPKNGILVVVLQYGLNHTDSLGRDRAQSDWAQAWKSNFLHPVVYYYDKLPTEEEMNHRPTGWPLPRPKAIHHLIEDFLTKWDGAVSHIQPLRRFLEHCLQTDLRAFYAESCFKYSLTHRKPPMFCRQGYLKQQGVVHDDQLGEHVTAGSSRMDVVYDPLKVQPLSPNYLGASVTPGLKLGF